jgi:hypothetical protein
MKLPDAVIDKLQDGKSPVIHCAMIEGDDMFIRYTCDGKAIGQTMFRYTRETYVDWFRSMMNEMNPKTGSRTKQNKPKVRKKPTSRRVSQSRGPHSRQRELRRRG